LGLSQTNFRGKKMFKVIEKVRKLIALGTNDGASEGERDNAIRMAHGLLAKHNLAMADIQESVEERIERFSEYQNKPWTGIAAKAMADLFFCGCYQESKKANIAGTGTKRKIYFIGKESNVTTAILMADYVISTIGRERNRNKYSYSFCNGAAHRILQRVSEIIASSSIQEGESTSTDLALISVYKSEQDANKAFIQNTVGELRKSKSSTRSQDLTAYWAGHTYGNGISLNGQINEDSSSTKQIA